MREANEIDFWRGFALITIFINHIPALYFEQFTHRHVSVSDSAELFVFLAGWSLRLLSQSSRYSGFPGADRAVAVRLLDRARQFYIAQLAVTVFALGMLAVSAWSFDTPWMLDWHNAGVVFRNPEEAALGVVLMTHQLNYFDILPLYVVLMVAAPAIVILYRRAPWALLPVSLTIYAVTLFTGVNLPVWPGYWGWFFNPFSWQLIFVLGFLLAGKDGLGRFARDHRLAIRLAAIPIVVAGAFFAPNNFLPGIVVPPEYAMMFDKSLQGPVRIVHCLALVALIGGSFEYIRRFAGWLASFFSLLGRNSLNVFCAGSLLSLLGQIVLVLNEKDVRLDTLVLVCGVAVMGVVALASSRPARAPASKAVAA